MFLYCVRDFKCPKYGREGLTISLRIGAKMLKNVLEILEESHFLVKITDVTYRSSIPLAFVEFICYISIVKICLSCSLTLKYAFLAGAHTCGPPLSPFSKLKTHLFSSTYGF